MTLPLKLLRQKTRLQCSNFHLSILTFYTRSELSTPYGFKAFVNLKQISQLKNDHAGHRKIIIGFVLKNNKKNNVNRRQND